jgi:hypothetical protein
VRACRRLTVYAVVAALCAGAATYPTTVEARPLDNRSDATISSITTKQEQHDNSGVWDQGNEQSEAEPSFFHKWLASIYIKLIKLKSALGSALAYAWNLGHTKPTNTCS